MGCKRGGLPCKLAGTRLQSHPYHCHQSLGDRFCDKISFELDLKLLLPRAFIMEILLRTLILNKSISVSSQKLSLITTEVCVLHRNVIDILRTGSKRLHQGCILSWERM